MYICLIQGVLIGQCYASFASICICHEIPLGSTPDPIYTAFWGGGGGNTHICMDLLCACVYVHENIPLTCSFNQQYLYGNRFTSLNNHHHGNKFFSSRLVEGQGTTPLTGMMATKDFNRCTTKWQYTSLVPRTVGRSGNEASNILCVSSDSKPPD